MGLCYFPPQWWPWREPALPPAWFGEEAIPFMPGWALVYQSVFLLHAAAMLLGGGMGLARRYALAVAGAYALAAVCFWCWPTFVVRPASSSVLFRVLVSSMDGPGNALPSLHAAMSVLGVLRFWKSGRGLVRAALMLWWAAMTFATLALHQHRVVDLLAGSLLGGSAWVIAGVVCGGSKVEPRV